MHGSRLACPSIASRVPAVFILSSPHPMSYVHTATPYLNTQCQVISIIVIIYLTLVTVLSTVVYVCRLVYCI